MKQRRGSIYPYIATLVGGTWWMRVDDIAALSAALTAYQRDNAIDHAEAQLAIALTRVVEKRVRPSLQKKLRPQDVDDVCSEIILGFWKFRHSVRPEEVDKLIHTLAQRKQADLLRGIYKDAEHAAPVRSADERELLALLPDRAADAAGGEGQDCWEALSALGLSPRDQVVSWLVAEGIEKQVIAKTLGIDATTISRSLRRARKALEGRQRQGQEAKP